MLLRVVELWDFRAYLLSPKTFKTYLWLSLPQQRSSLDLTHIASNPRRILLLK